MLTREQYHLEIERNSTLFVEIIESADLSVEVPDCPGWTLLDLVRHVGVAHRWAQGAIVSGVPLDVPDGPVDPAALALWFEEGAVQLVGLLRATDADAPAWTFGTHPRRASFWSRRIAHETAMHRVDAQHALKAPTSIDAMLAADGVDEVVSLFFPRQVRKGHIPPLVPGIQLVLHEVPGVVYVLAGDGSDIDPVCDALITGPAEQILLALWDRATVDDLHIDGNRQHANAVLSSAITP